jgi:methylmalonyl-CoA mutase N-terminal domain/subunit
MKVNDDSSLPEKNALSEGKASSLGKEAWRKSFDKGGKREIAFATQSGKEVVPLAMPEHVSGLDYEKDLGYPGQYPFTRGIHPTMYHGRLWTMRQFSGFGTAKDTNGRYKYLLDHGQTGLSVAFDFPTLMGYDSDHQRSLGEVGRCGVAISSLKDMETLFDGIPLDKISTSMTINGPAAILFAFYLAVGEKQGVPLDKLRGTIQNDILKEYIAQKSWLVRPEPSMRIITDIMAFSAERVPLWNTISISGYHIREAGSTALQELAFTLADGLAYVEAGIKAGMDVDTFAPRLSFFWDSHMDLFEEVAKMRAARRIWSREMRNKYKAKNPRSWMVRFHTQTAGCSLMAQQPWNNVVRTAYEALAAVLGGTQSLHTNSMDETYALPTEEAVKLALRTQQVLAFETGVPNTIDPLAGSYFVEHLTGEMEKGCYEYFDRIEKLGGVIPAIEKGFFQREISAAAFRYQKEIEEKRRVIVGVNDYVEEDEEDIQILKIDPRIDEEQANSLTELRASRDNRAVQAALEDLAEACRDGSNLMPRILEAARAYATLGEIADVLRREFGEYREPPSF